MIQVLMLSAYTSVPGPVALLGYPRGCKYPIFEVSGSRNHTLNGIWGQTPQMLGTWTLWLLQEHLLSQRVVFQYLRRKPSCQSTFAKSLFLSLAGQPSCCPKYPNTLYLGVCVRKRCDGLGYRCLVFGHLNL